MKSINPKYDIGNNQTPETRTMQSEKHGKIELHVCNEELWRMVRMKLDIDAGRYLNLPPVNLKEYNKHKKKRGRKAKYGRGNYPA